MTTTPADLDRMIEFTNKLNTVKKNLDRVFVLAETHVPFLEAPDQMTVSLSKKDFVAMVQCAFFLDIMLVGLSEFPNRAELTLDIGLKGLKKMEEQEGETDEIEKEAEIHQAQNEFEKRQPEGHEETAAQGHQAEHRDATST